MKTWIAVDWGTTHLRAYLMGDAVILAEASSCDGMNTLTQDAYEPTLLRLVGTWLSQRKITEIIACGMVGARQGWQEAPYRTTPCTPLDPTNLVSVPTTDPRLHIRLIPGLRQNNPADVMRGEETQIAGVLALHPQFDGVICLPGTHSKWAHISAGEVVSFQTFMTGELFSLLSNHSVLRHGMQTDAWDEQSFILAVDDALSRPEKIAARLFSLRAESLIADLRPAAARARLSGLLIGIELAAAKPYWLGQDVILVGTEVLSSAYANALALQGVTSRQLSATACTLAGTAQIAKSLV